MNLTKRLRVEPGSKVDLAAIDPSFHGKWASAEAAKDELTSNIARITTLQRKLYADRGHCLLIVLQGIDGAGKDGTCWHVMSAMDPEGVDVSGFKQPTPEEKDHDFLWRVHPHAPGRGRIAIFNRSHYEDVLVVRVHKLVPKDVWKPRYDFINDWEKLLATENGTTILKFFLYISKEEQLARFKERLDDPARQWKIRPAIIPNATCGTSISSRSRTRCRVARRNTRRGSSFRPITNGFATSPYRASSPTRWRT